MTHDDETVERVAAAINDVRYSSPEYPWPAPPFEEECARGQEYAYRLARAALSAISERELPPDTIPMPRNTDEAKAMALIGEHMLRASGEIKERPDAALLREALDALTRIERELSMVIDTKQRVSVPISIAFESARAIADKIRAALEGEPTGERLAGINPKAHAHAREAMRPYITGTVGCFDEDLGSAASAAIAAYLAIAGAQ